MSLFEEAPMGSTSRPLFRSAGQAALPESVGAPSGGSDSVASLGVALGAMPLSLG